MFEDIVLDVDEEFDLATPDEQKKLISNTLLSIEINRSKSQGMVTDRLGRCFIIMVDNAIGRKWFHPTTFSEDLKNEALLALVRIYGHISINPYAYFHTIIQQSIERGIDAKKKQSYITDILKENILCQQ